MAGKSEVHFADCRHVLKLDEFEHTNLENITMCYVMYATRVDPFTNSCILSGSEYLFLTGP